MILSALVFLCCTTLSAATPATPENPPAIGLESTTSPDPAGKAEDTRPDAPAPKMAASPKAELAASGGGEAIAPGSQPLLNSPVKPASTESYETRRKRMIWYGLMAAGHGTAAFDAWTTRRAVESGYGIEGDPLQRPFAHSGAIYATTQVTPLLMDYLGHRMMRSEHPLLRKAWWVPQVASASVSLGAGIHNYHVVP